MTRGFLQHFTIVRCVIRHLRSSKRMPKKPAHTLSDRKASQSSTTGILVDSYLAGQTNLNLNPSRFDRMSEIERAASNDSHHQVEYLESPHQSENDKKEYRLENCRLLHS